MASTIKLVNRSFQEENQFQFSNRCCCFWTSLSWWIRLRTSLPRLWAFNSEVIFGNGICSDILKFDQQCPKSFSYKWPKNSKTQQYNSKLHLRECMIHFLTLGIFILRQNIKRKLTQKTKWGKNDHLLGETKNSLLSGQSSVYMVILNKSQWNEAQQIYEIDYIV